MKKSLGCFYSFDRTAIISAKVTDDGKIHLDGDFFTHTGVEEIANILKNFDGGISKIITNKHETLNSFFNYQLTQIDLRDEAINEELSDIFKSLNHKDLLILGEGIEIKLPHHKQALYMALKALNYYQEYSAMPAMPSMEFDCW